LRRNFRAWLNRHDGDGGDPERDVARRGIAGQERAAWCDRAGAYADVVAVAGDPLENVKLLENIAFVMKDGKVFKNDLAPVKQ